MTRRGATDPESAKCQLIEQLAAVPLIDQHCHSIAVDWQVAATNPVGWRRCFTEARHPESLARDVPGMRGYREFLSEFRRYLASSAGSSGPDDEDRPATTEDALAAERDRRAGRPDYVRALLDDAGIGALLIDTGFEEPGPRRLLGPEALELLVGRPVRPIARLERLAEVVLADAHRAATPARFEEAIEAAIEGAIDDGAVALKSIAAYRTGFALPEPSATRLRRALVDRASQARRLDNPAIEARLVAAALAVAARRRVPIQFHTGLGDDDLHLAEADPSLLHPILGEASTAGVTVVMLHCYPFVSHAAYLASVFPAAHVDLSLAIPLLGSAGARSCLSEALGLCPITKLLAGSDGHTLPEMHWRGGWLWRNAIAAVLGTEMEDGRIGMSEAEQAGAAVLAGNARRLYGI